MTAYYNEFDPYAAQWLRNLIAAGHIAPGVVDERSIEEVSADDLKGFTQCHFFAGIGGWSLAARLAGWPDDQPLWTGSCPCQPFSAAGKQRGTSDERHLWPTFFRLISECRPSAVAGEQVASRLGRDWLAGVRADLEGLGYAVGAADLCAAGVGAPHIRQRLWWVADADYKRRTRLNPLLRAEETGRDSSCVSETARSRSGHGGLADSKGSGQQARFSDRVGVNDKSRGDEGQSESEGGANRLADADELGQTGQQEGRREARHQPSRSNGGLGDSYGKGLEERASKAGLLREEGLASSRQTVELSSQWSGSYIPCADGKARRIEPSIEPLAHGVSNRVGRLRAYGNAIVPQVAAEVLKAFMASEF